MVFLEKLIKRLARDCDENHSQLYNLLVDIIHIKEDYKLQVVKLIDPELQNVKGFADQIVKYFILILIRSVFKFSNLFTMM